MHRPQPAPSGGAQLHGERFEFGEPWGDLLALPLSLLAAHLLRLSWFGRLLLVPVQIQFHELGHALTAWLSSRAALPLPFGFTFWQEEKSRFVSLCMLFLLSVLILRSEHERRYFGVALGALLFAGFCALSWLMPAERSLAFLLAGGIAGELLLSALVMVAFFFPLPDRLRWDFFRFLALPAAAATWLSAAALWLGVRRGTSAFPRGSILGTPGDGSGDLDRLIDQHGFTEGGITQLYLGLVALSGLGWLSVYALRALRALRTLREARAQR